MPIVLTKLNNGLKPVDPLHSVAGNDPPTVLGKTASANPQNPVGVNGPLADDAGKLSKIADRIRKRMVGSITETGRDLLEAKAILPHGEFGKWIKCEFGITMRTAENYINVAKFSNSKGEIVSHLPAAILYKLAAPSTPEAVKIGVIAGLEKGIIPTMGGIVSQVNNLKKSQSSTKDCEATDAKKEKALLTQHVALEQAAETAVQFLKKHLNPNLFMTFVHLLGKTDGIVFKDAVHW